MYHPLMVHRSTDSKLKLWNIKQGQVLRTYRGHTNKKNFVGLTVSNDFISCGESRLSSQLYTVANYMYVYLISALIGSEDNSVYIYCKQVSKPMLKYKFTTPSKLLVRLH